MSNKQDLMLEEPTKEECIDAIDYLYGHGFVDEMTTDKKYYVLVLVAKVMNDYKYLPSSLL